MNKVFLIGNLTRDPELTQTATGISICRMGIAVNRAYINANGEREADFFDITVWRQQAEACHRFLKKGSKISIIGYLQKRVVEAQDGTKRHYIDITAEDVEFLSPREGSPREGGYPPREHTPREGGYAPREYAPRDNDGDAPRKSIRDNPPVSDDDLPF